ncbi:hypothetical protein [Streptomyces sp. SGAir0957]
MTTPRTPHQEPEPQTVAHGLTAKEAAFRLIADTTNNPETATQFRKAADEEREAALLAEVDRLSAILADTLKQVRHMQSMERSAYQANRLDLIARTLLGEEAAS